MTKEFQKTLRHDDFTITTDLCSSVTWMETMVGSLVHLRNSKHRSLACMLMCLQDFMYLFSSVYINKQALIECCFHYIIYYRIQQLHFEMAETLAELKELQLQNHNEEA